MEPERFEIGRRQRSRVTIFLAAIFTVGAVILAAAGAGEHWAKPWLGWAITLVAVAFVGVWVQIAYARAYTEITSDGFSTRAVSGIRRAAWTDVTAIKVVTYNGGSSVKVLVSGRRTAIRLGAPIRTLVTGGRDFNDEVARIRAAWNQARAAAR